MRRVSLPGGVPLCDMVRCGPLQRPRQPCDAGQRVLMAGLASRCGTDPSDPPPFAPRHLTCGVDGVGPSWPGRPRDRAHLSRLVIVSSSDSRLLWPGNKDKPWKLDL